MGLPVWREPTVVEAATKNDKPAHARSAIRRHRVRGNPYAASAYRLSNGIASQGGDAASSPRRSLLFEVIRRPHRRVSPPGDDSSSESDVGLDAIAHAADLARLEASNRRRTENGRALLRDALSYERPGRRLRDRPSDSSRHMPPPLPPVPESRDYARRQPWEVAIERTRLEDLYRRRGRMTSPTFVPTPPYTPGSGDSSARSSPHSQAITPPLGSATLTPGFPPAHRFPAPPHEPPQPPPAHPTTYTGADSSRPRPDPNYLDMDELPPLRRMRRRIVDGPIPNITDNPPVRTEPPRPPIGRPDGYIPGIRENFPLHVEPPRPPPGRTLDRSTPNITDNPSSRIEPPRPPIGRPNGYIRENFPLYVEPPRPPPGRTLDRSTPNITDNPSSRIEPPRPPIGRPVGGSIPNIIENPPLRIEPQRPPIGRLVDGLGDRERSLSPGDPWEALFPTITPDVHLPSTDSSFTSASASASFASHPASTSTSLATAPTSSTSSTSSSSLDPFPPGCDILDSDSDASMTEPDDDDFDAHEFSHLYHHPDHDYHPRSVPPPPPHPASRDRRSLHVPTAAERRQVEHMFREEMRMMMMGGPEMPSEWWES